MSFPENWVTSIALYVLRKSFTFKSEGVSAIQHPLLKLIRDAQIEIQIFIQKGPHWPLGFFFRQKSLLCQEWNLNFSYIDRRRVSHLKTTHNRFRPHQLSIPHKVRLVNNET